MTLLENYENRITDLRREVRQLREQAVELSRVEMVLSAWALTGRASMRVAEVCSALEQARKDAAAVGPLARVLTEVLQVLRRIEDGSEDEATAVYEARIKIEGVLGLRKPSAPANAGASEGEAPAAVPPSPLPSPGPCSTVNRGTP